MLSFVHGKKNRTLDLRTWTSCEAHHKPSHSQTLLLTIVATKQLYKLQLSQWTKLVWQFKRWLQSRTVRRSALPNVFSLFYIWSSSWKFLEFIRVNRLNLHDYGLYQVRKTTRRLWIQTSCVYKQTTKAQWQFHCQFLMTVYLVPFWSRRWIMYICR